MPVTPILWLSMIALCCTFTHLAWGGTSSRTLLPFEEALDILRNPDESEERRRTALGRLYRLSEEAAEAYNLVVRADATPPGLRDNAIELRRRVAAAWEAR